MGNYSFDLDCACCSITLLRVRNASALAWKANANNDNGHTVECKTCGCRFRTVDDGTSVGAGGGVKADSVAQPKIESLSVSTGPRVGGNTITINGHSLEIGSLTVKFAGNAAPSVSNRTGGSADVVVPFGTYHLNVAEYLHTLTLTITSGMLAVDETFTTAGGSSGIIRHIDGSTYMVDFRGGTELLADIIGTNLTGSGGGVATIDAATTAVFVNQELVQGLASGFLGRARSNTLLTVDEPTGSFTPGELVKGTTSGAMVKLDASSAYSGTVDVTVENEHGQRLAGGTLAGAYTYL